MCKKICLLRMPNMIYRPSGLKPEEELALKILSIQKGIRRGSSKILKCRKKKKHKEADNSNFPNSISTSDAETEDDAEPEKDGEKNDPPEVREEEAPDKRKKYVTPR